MYKSDAQKMAERQVKLQLCRWFLMCRNKAVKVRPHVILGQVPICKRCDDKMEVLSR